VRAKAKIHAIKVAREAALDGLDKSRERIHLRLKGRLYLFKSKFHSQEEMESGVSDLDLPDMTHITSSNSPGVVFGCNVDEVNAILASAAANDGYNATPAEELKLLLNPKKVPPSESRRLCLQLDNRDYIKRAYWG
jgi:hypothetical protein